MFALGLQSYDGPLARMPEGCWSRASTGAVYVSCPECGGVDRVEAVDTRGAVTECFFCQTATCSFRRYLRLEGWTPWDVSDARSGK